MTEIILAVCVAVCIALAGRLIYNHKKIRDLTKSIDEFLDSKTVTSFSTADGALAQLQNSICDLETKLLRESENTVEQARRNSEFISDISHQLKTPLAGIRLYCEMADSATAASHADKQLLLIEKMEKLIQNVLRLEKIRSDSYAMQFEQTQLSELLQELQKEFSALFAEKKISISGNAVLRCDRVWLREAIGNVIKNACEHTEKDGSVDITITAAEKSILVIIEDNGGGVPVQELPFLFRRFYRAQNASPDSAGIGLAIAKEIVEKHHGIITAENGKKGLRVVMCFPLIDANKKI